MALAHETFHKSQESYLEFLKTAERRAIAVSPDYKLAWQRAFKLQRLLKKRQTLRFDYLFGSDKFDSVTLRSLTSIGERLDKGWSEAEEAALKESGLLYKDISREIVDIQSKWDAHALDVPRRALEQDLKYRDARQALAERAQKLLAQLGG